MRLNFRRKRYLSHLLRDVKSSIEALRFEIKPDLHDFLLRRYSLNDRRFFIGAVMLLAVYQPALCNTINKYFALTRYFSRNSQSPISLQKTIPGFNVTVKKKKDSKCHSFRYEGVQLNLPTNNDACNVFAACMHNTEYCHRVTY